MSRLAKLPPYLFVELDAARRAALARGQDVIDLGIGDPDRPTPQPIVAAMAAAVCRPEHHRYPANQGADGFRAAAADWLSRRGAGQPDPDRQILALIGSKEGLGHLPLALLEEGDEVLVPAIGYPVYAQATLLAGGVPVVYPLRAERGFRPEWADLDRLVTPRTRLLFLNYPNNPTGAGADRALLATAAEFGARQGVAVAHDAAYLETALGAARAPSLLEVADPARQRVIEFHSLSKMFNMTGWRVGFAVGNADLIRDLGRVKENLDSGVFSAVQEAAAFALGARCDQLLAEVREVYPPRRAMLAAALREAGIEVFETAFTFYIWARVPGGEGSLTFCRRVLDRQGVVLAPGIGFGPGGEGWFRASLTAPDDRVAEAAARLRRL